MSGSTPPFRCMNSALSGLESTVTVLPDWLVNVKPVNVKTTLDIWSFAVLAARTVTEVFSVCFVPVSLFPPPHPVMKAAVRRRQNVGNKRKTDRPERRKDAEFNE